MQYVDYQHMIVNEIKKYILYWSYLHAFINITFSNSFQYLMNFHISRFFLNNNVFWSLICKYVYSTINKFFWKIFNLSNIYTTINTNFPNFFHFFFYQIPQVNLLHVPVYNCNFFFWLYRYQHYAHRIFSWRHVLCLYTYSQHHI